MTCDNIDFDANVFAQNCIIFVHCAMFALSLFLYACVHVRFSYVYSTLIQRVYAAAHSYSCVCGVACSVGVRAYILLYMRSLVYLVV